MSRSDSYPMRRHRLILSFITLSLFNGVMAGGQTPAATDDGPYVFWSGANSAVVYYYCDSEIRRERYSVADTLRFMGLCSDSLTQYTIATGTPETDPATYSGIPRIFAVSDIHGEYDALCACLKRAGVIDSNRNWTWGDGHLVICGDVFDRGEHVTESLWLIHRLEREAELSGGRVHYLIGNHEEMALHGDNRYVNEKYLSGIALKSRLPYQDLFGVESALGRWLRTRNTIVRLNGILFVHGGLSPQYCGDGLQIDSVNARMRQYLAFNPVHARLDSAASFNLGVLGPLWYRGYFEGDERGRYTHLSQEEVTELLECAGASAIVVGHTEQPHAGPHYNGLVYSLDVPIDELGGTEALLWKKGRVSRVTVEGEVQPID